jgi:hypothetical protein
MRKSRRVGASHECRSVVGELQQGFHVAGLIKANSGPNVLSVARLAGGEELNLSGGRESRWCYPDPSS